MPSSQQLLEQAHQDLKSKAFANAQSKAHALIKQEPSTHGAWQILGLVAIEENNISEAIGFFQKAVAVEPRANYYFNLGVAYRRLGKLTEAIQSYQECVKLDATMLRAWGNLGNAYRAAKQHKLALKCYERCVELEPKNSMAHYNSGILHQLEENFDEAIKAYRRAIKYNPNHAKALCNLGTIYAKLRRFEKATSYYEQALEIDNQLFDAYNNYGSALIELEQHGKAENLLRKALKLQPDSVHTLRNITLCKSYQHVNDKDALYINKLLENPDLTDLQRMHLYFALGKIHTDVKLPDKAFQYYQKGNALHHKAHPFNIYSLLDYTKGIMDIFTQSFIHENRNQSSSTIRPIVIVGSPRSGKSLLEKMLQQHPDIEGAGEVGLAEFANVRHQGNHKEVFPDWCLTVTQEDMTDLVKAYENKLLRDVSAKKYLIDTMPGNAYYCGLFALLFPEAKIIYMDREPEDLALKMYFKFFINKHYYAYNLKTLGQYHRVFEHMMTHWQKVLDKQMIRVSYDDLVKQPKAVLKKLCSFLHLESCDHQLQINKDEVGFSKAYEAYLEPLRKGLQFDPSTNKSQIAEVLKKASIKHKEQSYEEAAKLYRYVLNLDPENAIAIHLLGVVAFETGRQDKAIELVEQALELNPNYMQAHANIATMFEQMGQEEKAKEHQQKAYEVSLKINSQRNKVLSDEHRKLLSSAMNKPLRVIREYERKMLFQGESSPETLQSLMTKSWDRYFNDLSYGSYRPGGTAHEPIWRLRTWHYLFKNLSIVHQLFNHEKDSIKILDVGCSKAFFRRFIEGNVSPTDDKQLLYWGIDVRKDMLESAMTQTNHVESGAAGNFMPSAYIAHDIANGLPMKDDFFEVVVCFEMLKYCPVDVGMQLLYEMHRTLAPGGMLYLSTSYDATQKDFMMGMTFDELLEILKAKGFVLKGDFGGQAMPEPILEAASIDNQEMVEKLCQYHPPGMVSAMLAPLYPQVATTRVFHLMKKEDS